MMSTSAVQSNRCRTWTWSKGLAVFGLLFFLGSAPSFAQIREEIRITGSSTLYPFVTAVADDFGRQSPYKAPVVEGIGTGGGMKVFCAGVGTDHPDIVNASRKIKASELAYCVENGVDEIIEIKVGYDGIVFANTRVSERLNLSLRDIYLALAKFVPAPNSVGGPGNMIPNPHQKWSDVNPALPDTPILVLGPPPTSGTRDTLNEKALNTGCNSFKGLAALARTDPIRHKLICQSIREDNVYVDSGENDNLIVQKLQSNYDAVGIFGFSFLDQNSDVLQPAYIRKGSTLVAPNFDTIADTDYPIYRALYFYVKIAHIDVIPGLRDYIKTFTSEDTWGDFGYLVDKGLIPLKDAERRFFAEAASEMRKLNIDDFVQP